MPTRKNETAGSAGLTVDGRRSGNAARNGLLVASNVTVRAEGAYVPRDGRNTIDASATDLNRLYFLPPTAALDSVLVRSSVSTNHLAYFNGSAFANFGTSGKYVEASTLGEIHMLLASNGLSRVLPGSPPTFQVGFIPMAFDLDAALLGSTGWLAANETVAYKFVYGRKLANGATFEGAPSGRVVITNTAGAPRNVRLTFSVSPSLISGTVDFYRIYRTEVVSADNLGVDPGEEVFLIYERFLTGGDVVADTVTVDDVFPSGGGGPALYTNESVDQAGALATKFPCPAAAHTVSSVERGYMAEFGGCLWAAPYRPLARTTFFILAVGPGTLSAVTFTANTHSNTTVDNIASTADLVAGMRIEGTDIPANTNIVSIDSGTAITISNAATGTTVGVSMTAGDRFVIDGQTYVAWTSEVIASNKFLVSTSTDAATRIRDTSLSLIRVFNRSASTTFGFMRYLSGAVDFPGQIYLIAFSKRDSSSTIQIFGHHTAVAPSFESATPIPSLHLDGRLSRSEFGDPFGWREDAFFDVPGGAEICGLTALRYSLLVWTTRGLYRVYGKYPSFVMELLDFNIKAWGVDTGKALGAVSAGNEAYGYCTQGLVRATDSGAQVVSAGAVMQLLRLTPPAAGRLSVDPREQLVYVPISGTTLVYHPETQARRSVWTEVDGSLLHLVMHDDLGVMFAATGAVIHRYRDKTADTEGIWDTEQSTTISVVGSGTVTLTGNQPSVGWVVSRGGFEATVTAVVGGGVYTVAPADHGLTTGAGTIYSPVSCDLVWCPASGVQQAVEFHGGQVSFQFDGGRSGGYRTSGGVALFGAALHPAIVTLKMLTDFDAVGKLLSTVSESAFDYWYPKSSASNLRVYTPPATGRFASVLIHANILVCRSFFELLGWTVEGGDGSMR